MERINNFITTAFGLTLAVLWGAVLVILPAALVVGGIKLIVWSFGG